MAVSVATSANGPDITYANDEYLTPTVNYYGGSRPPLLVPVPRLPHKRAPVPHPHLNRPLRQWKNRLLSPNLGRERKNFGAGALTRSYSPSSVFLRKTVYADNVCAGENILGFPGTLKT